MTEENCQGRSIEEMKTHIHQRADKLRNKLTNDVISFLPDKSCSADEMQDATAIVIVLAQLTGYAWSSCELLGLKGLDDLVSDNIELGFKNGGIAKTILIQEK